MLIIVTLYAFIAIKEYDKVIEFIFEKLDFLNFIKEDIVGVIILGLAIAVIAWLLWPIIVLVIIIFVAFYWFKDKKKLIKFFKELF